MEHFLKQGYPLSELIATPLSGADRKTEDVDAELTQGNQAINVLLEKQLIHWTLIL